MSLVDQFQDLFVRRNRQRTFETKKEKYRNNSNTSIYSNKLSQSIYDRSFQNKTNISPKKHNIERFQELRKRLTSRANIRSKKMAMNSTTKDFLQLNNSFGNTEQVVSSELSCSKAVMHINQRTQEIVWKKNMKKIGIELQNKSNKKQVNQVVYIKPSRRFSQQVHYNNKNNKIKDFIMDPIFEVIDNSSVLAFKSISGNQNYRVKAPLGKQSSQKTSRTKQTRNSDNELDVYRIEAWGRGIVDDDGLMF